MKRFSFHIYAHSTLLTSNEKTSFNPLLYDDWKPDTHTMYIHCTYFLELFKKYYPGKSNFCSVQFSSVLKKKMQSRQYSKIFSKPFQHFLNTTTAAQSNMTDWKHPHSGMFFSELQNSEFPLVYIKKVEK